MTRLVLLSGWGCDARIWQPLAEHWPEGVSVTTPDWPGYGGRDPLAAPDSLDALAEAMARELPADAIWVGWSLGGLLAGALLEHLPLPRGLILLGMGARFCDPAGVTRAELSAFRRAFARDPQATLAHFQRWQLGGEPSPRDAHRRLRALLGGGPCADPASLAAGLRWLENLDLTSTLADADCPVIRLVGACDPLQAPAVIASAELVLEHAGHCPMLSRPAALAEALVTLAAVPHRAPATEEACP